MRIRLLPEAERDLEIGADFYESQQPGLGVYFHDCLADDMESLRQYAGFTRITSGFIAHFANGFHLQSTTSSKKAAFRSTQSSMPAKIHASLMRHSKSLETNRKPSEQSS